MNTLSKYRQLIVAAIGIASLVMSLGISGRALAAQNMADVSVTIVADKSRVKIGENITYIVTITNLGPNAALFVEVAHGLSDQLNFVSVTCDGGISSDGPFCEYSILQPGQNAVSILIATPNPSIQNHERNALTATATTSFETADTIDSDNGNNWASVTVKLIGRLTRP
ncbi:MAG TPA: DUF11 domain-containing protein [Anaerolineales bacterium]